MSVRGALGGFVNHLIGLPGGDRTPDNLLRRQVLYPTELRADLKPERCLKNQRLRRHCFQAGRGGFYPVPRFALRRKLPVSHRSKPQTKNAHSPMRTVCISIFWSGRKDSNLRPSGPKPDALPGCATPRQAFDSSPDIWGYRKILFSAFRTESCRRELRAPCPQSRACADRRAPSRRAALQGGQRCHRTRPSGAGSR